MREARSGTSPVFDSDSYSKTSGRAFGDHSSSAYRRAIPREQPDELGLLRARRGLCAAPLRVEQNPYVALWTNGEVDHGYAKFDCVHRRVRGTLCRQGRVEQRCRAKMQVAYVSIQSENLQGTRLTQPR